MATKHAAGLRDAILYGPWGNILPALLFAGTYLRWIINNLYHSPSLLHWSLFSYQVLEFVLYLLRKRPKMVSTSLVEWATVSMCLLTPILMLPLNTHERSRITLALGVLASAMVLYALASLRRSWGVVPANRGIITRGPYAIIRHPIYASKMVAYAAYVLHHQHLWNLALLMILFGLLLIRIRFEERLLRADADYRTYCLQVRWRLVPGIF